MSSSGGGDGARRFINGMKAQGTPLKDARVVFFGAGSSAVGVALTIASLLVKETGVSKDEALKVWLSPLPLPLPPHFWTNCPSVGIDNVLLRVYTSCG